MKRILSFLLCVVILLSCPVVGSGATTTNRDALAAEIMNDINALGTITPRSGTALAEVNQKIVNFGYLYGNYQYDLIENLSVYEAAVEQYNSFPQVKCLFGDITDDLRINSKDAMETLNATVGKVSLDDWQRYVADVNLDGTVNAMDALMILQYAVHKRVNFPADETVAEPFQEQVNLYSKKSEQLYENTYQSMVDRIQDNGFTNTSLTGAYEGMYFRDASIQILAHVTQGDFDQARMILNYITEYHREKNLSYVMYIKRTHDAYHKQTDTTFFFLHSWVQFALNAPKTAENKAYIEGSYDMVKKFANYYLDNNYMRADFDNLLYNESFEHSRDGSYFQSFDLVTNVYASQALHEMAEYFKTMDPAHSKKWQEASTKIANGIHSKLTVSVNGSLMYAEFYGTKKPDINDVPETDKKFYAGLSWVNLAPASCDWYAAKPEILEHTYQTYLEYGSIKYRSNVTGKRYTMLEVYSDLNVSRPRRLTGAGNHIIGKGLAWEMMYCQKTGKTDRLAEIIEFIEVSSTTFYPEVYAYNGLVNDTGNQEQASWLLVAHHDLQSK